MATRINRKNPSTTTSREVVGAEKITKCVDEANVSSNISNRVNATSPGKNVGMKASTKKVGKKTSIGIKLKAKAKHTAKINKKLKRKILRGAKNSEKPLRNGLKVGKITKIKTVIKKDKDDGPPVLEPIVPLVEPVNTKKKLKKRTKNHTDTASQILNVKKIKVETEEETSQSNNVEDSSIMETTKKQSKKQRKSNKNLNDCTEAIVNDVSSFLIKREELNTENDSLSESGKSDVVKVKRITRKQKMEPLEFEPFEEVEGPLILKEEIKVEPDTNPELGKNDLKSKKIAKNQRIELLKKQVLKKENIESTIEKLDETDGKVIDVLDLNVRTVKKKSVSKRRHSIEKFPMGSDDITISQNFSHLPRSMSPRSKRNAKVRQSSDSMSRRSSPYSTRSDSPARILRNGKQRKWIDMNLVEGLDTDVKKRKRLCSDLSGSEMSVSKLSEYESDSSFSDLASFHGAENIEDLAVKSSTFKDSFEEGPIDVTNGVTEKNTSKKLEIIDTNSNVCNNVNKFEIKTEQIETNHESEDSVVKVPDKSIILGIMKQAFNETISDKSVPTSTFYGNEKTQSTTVENLKDENDSVVTSETSESFSNAITHEDNCPEINLKPEEKIIPEENDEIVTNSGVDNLEIVNEFKETDQVETNEQQNEVDSILSYIIEHVEKMEEQEILPLKELETDDSFSEPKEDVDESVKKVVCDNFETSEGEQNTPLKENVPIEGQESVSQMTDIEDCVNQTRYENFELDSNIVQNVTENKPEFDTKFDIVKNSEIDLVRNSELDLVKNSELDLVNNSELDLVNNSELDLVKNSELDIVKNSKLTDGNDPISSDSSGNTLHKMDNESALDVTEKESILKALGLQSLRTAEHSKQTHEETFDRSDNYTGTLKTVIKLNRDKKKGPRIGSIKMALPSSKNKMTWQEIPIADETSYKDAEEGIPKYDAATSSETAGAHRKSYSHRSNIESSTEHISDGEGTSQDDTIKALVIPEKASSFSIHPGRLCKDECSYCFGKFGLFDTPCHIAQMKSVDRQDKILATEKHLMRDSCLCDACYRHVDRKSNTPSYMNKSLKRNSLVAPGPKENHCHVLGCNKLSTNILRRKWIIKMKKNICQVINIDLDNPGLHSIPICDEHYSALEHLMICSMCKRRLARNHIHYLGPETNALNTALTAEGIPITLTDKPVVCKLCKCFASIILKDAEERSENSINFFNEYKRRLLHFNDILPMDESAAEEPISFPSKTDKLENSKKKKKGSKNTDETDSVNSMENIDEKNDRLLPSDTNNDDKSRSESPSDEYNVVDYNTLIPAIAMDCGSDNESRSEPPSTQPIIIKKILRNEKNQDAVEISRVYKSNINKNKSDIAVQKLGSNPSISVRQLFPGEEDLPLGAHIDFNNVKDHTPEGWEKCTSVIQYDVETKRLWQELQKPYGNQSSFLRHLILLEKYFRNGDLVLSANASHHSINYSESVHNRLRAYDNISANAKNVQPLSMIPFNKIHEKYGTEPVSCTNVATSQTSPTNGNQKATPTTAVNRIASSAPSVVLTPQSAGHKIKGNTALTITQLNNPVLTSGSTVLQQIRPKMVSAPPGLISLHPGTNKPIAPLVKVPQSQKIKFPITKNWRPNLIPIDPTKKQERKAGLVQVISGGKPYHITLEDYKKMCAIKRSFEMKQKRLQEVHNAKPILVTHNSVLKSITPKKGLIISKAVSSNVAVKIEQQLTPSSFKNGENENILQKLDKQVEKLESKISEKSSMLLPRIPKSLTVIPQTVSKPSSPVLEITPKVSSKS